MAISDYIYPGLDIASAVLGITDSSKYGNRARQALEPTSWDTDYERMFQDYNARLQALTGQLADTSSPEFQTRLKTRMDEIMRGVTDSLRQQQSLNAARVGRGLQGLVNPERRDEAMARNLASARSAAEAQARAEVIKEMAEAATQTRGAMGITGQIGAAGLANERARRAAQSNVQSAYDQTGNASWLALAKSVLPLVMKGVDFTKAADVSKAFNQGWVSDAEQAAGIGQPFTNPFQPQTQASFTMPVPQQQWSESPSWNNTPSVSPADWDISSGVIPGFELPDFTVPSPTIDAGDWWAMDSSVNWTPDLSGFDAWDGWNLGSGWGY